MTDSDFEKLQSLGLDADGDCSCYYCFSYFKNRDITVWTTDNPPEAICPFCLIDAVIHDHVEPDQLSELYNKYWGDDY